VAQDLLLKPQSVEVAEVTAVVVTVALEVVEGAVIRAA
jgi:hypothetical protein